MSGADLGNTSARWWPTGVPRSVREGWRGPAGRLSSRDGEEAGSLRHQRGTSMLVLLGICVLAGGCAGSPSLPSAPVRATSTSTSTARASAASHSAALDRSSLRKATLDVTSGATSVDIKVAALSKKLLAASTPATSGQGPVLARSADGVATVQLSSIGDNGGPSQIDVVLDSSVVWTIDLDGGATAEHLDMRGGVVDMVDLSAGTTRATIILPARQGTQLVREVGGASELAVIAPASEAAQIQVEGGAGSVQIGAITHTGVAGGTAFADIGYLRARQRLEVQLVGGVSSVRVR